MDEDLLFLYNPNHCGGLGIAEALRLWRSVGPVSYHRLRAIAADRSWEACRPSLLPAPSSDRTLIRGFLDGCIRISTSFPRRFAKSISFSKENLFNRPRAKSETRGWGIPRMAPALTWLSLREDRIKLTWRAISALARASSGFGRPISAKTLPLPTSTSTRLRFITLIPFP